MMDKQGIVYVTQDDGRFNLAPLKPFGVRNEPLFGRSVFPDDAEERVPVMERIAKAKLSRFNPETDYLALAGDPVSVAVASAALAKLLTERGEKKFTVLKWDRESRGYYPVEINI